MVGPWANPVDFFEPLQWIPTPKRSRARKLYDGLIDVYGSMIRRFKTLMDSGEEVPNCLMKMLLESQEDEKLGWEDLCMLAAVFTLGGVHSVGCILYWVKMQLPHEFSADVWHHPMVPCFDTLPPTRCGKSLWGIGSSRWTWKVSQRRGWAQLSLYSGNHQRGTPTLFISNVQQDSDMLGKSIGSSRSRSILDGYTPLHNARLHLPGNVHTKEYRRGT